MATRYHAPSSIDLQLAKDVNRVSNTFADHGDSGAWVLNSMGDLVEFFTPALIGIPLPTTLLPT
jgi:hypothetical protein